MNSLSLIVLVGALAIDERHAAEIKERLVGADIAGIGEFPYQVSIRLNNKPLCSGALITRKHVLTAAHCVYPILQWPKGIKFMTVVAGTNSLTSGGKTIKVKALSHYDKYYDQTVDPHFMYDIGVITLAQEVAESPLIKIISLTSKPTESGEKAVIAGWGATKTPVSPASDILRKLDVNVVSNSMCQMFYKGMRNIVPTHVCALKSRGAGVCSGDSGGPLVSNGELIGVVSGGIACAKGFPDIYTRVEPYLDYIHGIINKS